MIDVVKQYAERVTTKKIPAGQYIRLECQRFLDDLKRSEEDSDYHLEWHPEKAEQIFEFAKLLNVRNPAIEQREPFILLDWQKFIVGSWAGWLIRGNNDPLSRRHGERRFREVVILTGRGSGKSPLGIMIALYMMCEQASFNGVVLATVDKQAWRPFKLFEEMKDRELDPSEFIDKAFEVTGATSNMNGMLRFRKGYDKSFPWLKGNTGELMSVGEGFHAESRVGGELALVIPEEYQAFKSNATLKTFTSGFKGNRQSLVLYLMNACEEKRGVAWTMLERNRAALKDSELNQDDILHAEFAIDEADHDKVLKKNKDGRYPAETKKLWMKAQPSYGKTVSEYSFVSQLNNMGSELDRQNAMRRLFSVTPDYNAGELWFDVDYWEQAQIDKRPDWVDNEGGVRLYLGLDIGMTQAFTSLSQVFLRTDGDVHAEILHYTYKKDKKNLIERGAKCKIDFVKWEEEGVFEATPGEYTDLGYVARKIKELRRQYNVIALGVDNHKVASDFAKAADRNGLDWKWILPHEIKEYWQEKLQVIDHPQGGAVNKAGSLSMKLSMERLERRMKTENQTITVLRNKLSDFMFACTMVIQGRAASTGATRRQWLGIDENAGKSGREFCDGIIALTQAVGIIDWQPVAEKEKTKKSGFAAYAAQLKSRREKREEEERQRLNGFSGAVFAS